MRSHEARTSSCTRCFSIARPSCRSFRCAIDSIRRRCSFHLRSRSFAASRSAAAARRACWWSRWTPTPAAASYCATASGSSTNRGRQLAAVRHFTVKKVRSLQNIRRLLERSLTIHAAPAAAPAPVTAPASAAGEPAVDPISNLIGELLSSKGEFVWNPNDAGKTFFELGLDSLAPAGRGRGPGEAAWCASLPDIALREPRTLPRSLHICERRFPMSAPRMRARAEIHRRHAAADAVPPPPTASAGKPAVAARPGRRQPLAIRC